MVKLIGFLAAFVLAVQAMAADAPPNHAFEQLTFPSLDRGADGAPVQVNAFLLRPPGDAPRPAVVMLHGCGGMLRLDGSMAARDADYAGRLVAAGYVVLAADSFTPRGVRTMCSQSNFRLPVFTARPGDAYGALLFLQDKPFVQPDRIGLVGWSQGGGVTLMTIRTHDSPRPEPLPKGDFRAAVAFYPGSCNEKVLKAGWETRIPFLVLIGDADVWTPLAPCKVLLDHAAERGSPIELHSYAGAYHDFDAPGMRLHEEPGYKTSAGVIPVLGTDPAARADAIARMMAFLAQRLGN